MRGVDMFITEAKAMAMIYVLPKIRAMLRVFAPFILSIAISLRRPRESSATELKLPMAQTIRLTIESIMAVERIQSNMNASTDMLSRKLCTKLLRTAGYILLTNAFASAFSSSYLHFFGTMI